MQHSPATQRGGLCPEPELLVVTPLVVVVVVVALVVAPPAPVVPVVPVAPEPPPPQPGPAAQTRASVKGISAAIRRSADEDVVGVVERY